MIENTDPLARIILYPLLMGAAIVLLFCIDMAAIPSLIPYAYSLNLILAGVFSLAILMPFTLPILPFFALGIIVDLMTSTPLGLNAAFYTICIAFTRWQWRYLSAQTFFVTWLAYGMILLAFQIFDWLSMGISERHLYSPQIALTGFVFAFLAFPLVFALFKSIDRILHIREEDA
ncbi:MAG: hypothetical protein AB7E85_03685 [Pseudobdellovibrionaceae bacterium]